jgi:hypothetical protein
MLGDKTFSQVQDDKLFWQYNQDSNSIAAIVKHLWGNMLSKGVKIHFAHRTFKWSNEARGIAAVHCVIVGFASFDTKQKFIFIHSNRYFLIIEKTWLLIPTNIREIFYIKFNTI